MKYEIRLSGSGGQGLITAGIILARAAALYDNKNSVQSQSYGPEARGGSSKAEVIISDDIINFPKVLRPDVFLALTQESFDKFSVGISENALIVVDKMLVTKYPKDKNIKVVPILESAENVLKRVISANIVSLGVLNSIVPLVSEAALEESVVKYFPEKAKELNIKALKLGQELARN